MRASRMNIVTLRETPADAEISSHQLLIRSGFMYKSGSGLYLYGPMLNRVLRKISNIVAEEISAAGGLEVTMPIMQERGLWEQSGRWQEYQHSKTMLTVQDRGGQEFGLAPTAEEVVTDYAAHLISSYKQLPVCYFQQHTKFRDEIRPRFGLMRVKEFIMMDAYSFHANEASLDETYEAMRKAYVRIFERCGLQAFAVEADSGSIGGSSSHEFMIGADVGEDTILLNAESGYAANVERATGEIPAISAWSATTEISEVATPNTTSIADVVAFLGKQGIQIDETRTLKTVLFIAQTKEKELSIAACIRGDRDVNEIKLSNVIGRLAGEDCLELRPMKDEEVRAATSAEPGFAAPYAGLNVDICIADLSLQNVGPLVAGANKTDTHLVGFDLERDASVDINFADILLSRSGDACPLSGKPLTERRGIEVGHIFKLGTKYAEPMQALFTDQDSKRKPMTMGCYGIGTSRVAAAAVEQYHDDHGMLWPMPIAPYHCVILATKKNDSESLTAAEELYKQLQASGIECIFDDRDLGPGVKFKDWDLIGIPMRIVFGRGFADGLIEVKMRGEASSDVAIADVAQWAQTQFAQAMNL